MSIDTHTLLTFIDNFPNYTFYAFYIDQESIKNKQTTTYWFSSRKNYETGGQSINEKFYKKLKH